MNDALQTSTAHADTGKQARHLLILLGGVLACAALLFGQERAVVPRELPSLVLDADAVAEALKADAALAKQVPKSEHADKLVALWREQSVADAAGEEPEYARLVRSDDLFFEYEALKREVGEPTSLALRAAMLQQVDAALDGELPIDEAREVLGGFPTMLAREGCTRDGEIVAPRFVMRTLMKARWNLSHNLAPDHAFVHVEHLAFYGWQALHADRLPPERRLNALEAYSSYGGKRVAQSAGVLLYRGGAFLAATEALAAAYKQTGNLRLRNAALGAAPAID